VIVYGQNIEEEESVAIWFPENDKSFPLFVTSSLFNLSLVRIRIFETLRLILKLLYRLIMVEQSRMAWTLSTIHEVRQPLQGLVAIADEIQRLTKIHTVSRREIRFWAEDMETGIWRLKVLLRSLDHLAGVDDVIPNNKEMFLYEDVIRPLRRSVIGIAEMHGLKVSEPINFDIIPKIVCDPELLSMIFYNLLLNAIKYSRKNSEISIFCGKTEDDYWIQVENEGVEILKDEVEKIFIKGYRGKNAKKIMWGLGIGLSVCQTIASRLKCRILLISRGGPQGKVIFRLYIPKGLNYESFNC
jgi:signal transduction histidine kinase